jgi:hypothetical protein
MASYRDDDGTEAALLEIASAKSVFGIALASIVIVAWAVRLIHL